MYCLNMLRDRARAGAATNPVYEDIATKFFEHFLYIADAMNNIGGEGIALWDEEDEFFYDVLHLPDGEHDAAEGALDGRADPAVRGRDARAGAARAAARTSSARLEWFLEHRPDLAGLVSRWQEPGTGERRLLSLVRGHRMKRLLRAHARRDRVPLPLRRPRARRGTTATTRTCCDVDGSDYTRATTSRRSRRSGLFGGNSNWRGPIWFPVNYLLIESLQKFHHYYGDDFQVECPTGSGPDADAAARSPTSCRGG